MTAILQGGLCMTLTKNYHEQWQKDTQQHWSVLI
jgi:hypothetical protein